MKCTSAAVRHTQCPQQTSQPHKHAHCTAHCNLLHSIAQHSTRGTHHTTHTHLRTLGCIDWLKSLRRHLNPRLCRILDPHVQPLHVHRADLALPELHRAALEPTHTALATASSWVQQCSNTLPHITTFTRLNHGWFLPYRNQAHGRLWPSCIATAIGNSITHSVIAASQERRPQITTAARAGCLSATHKNSGSSGKQVLGSSKKGVLLLQSVRHATQSQTISKTARTCIHMRVEHHQKSWITLLHHAPKHWAAVQ